MSTAANFILVLCDQLRYDVLGCNLSVPGGGTASICRTPNLDRMAGDGVVFDNAFSCCGICSPARASILTGRYPHNHGMLNNCHALDAVRDDLPADEVSLVGVLRDAGYRTGHVGKWHISARRRPEDFGFDDVELTDWPGFLAELGLGDGLPLARELYPPYAAPGEEPVLMSADGEKEEHQQEYHAFRIARGLLERYASEGRPFFLEIKTNAPHFPCTPPPAFNTYDPAEVPPWPNFVDDFAGKPAGHARLARQRGCDRMPWEVWAEYVARYFGVVSYIDHLMGELLHQLDRLGLSDSTYVIFTSDHGDMSGSHRIFNKGRAMYDELYHLPLIVKGPAVEAGRRSDAFVSSVDLMPTVLELAGVGLPARPQETAASAFTTDRMSGRLDGTSFAGEMTGVGSRPGRTYAAAEFHGDEFGLYSQRMIRTKRYKYVYNPAEVDELYDLAEDPGEMNNLVADPSLADVLAEHRAMLDEWMRHTRDGLGRWLDRGLL